MITKIVSGGQTGADRAALDWAIEKGLPHAGWCPKGRLSEDGPIALCYNLQETETDEYPERTKRNVRDSDGTVIFTIGPKLSQGSLLTLTTAQQLGKPCLHLSAEKPIDQNVLRLQEFVKQQGIEVLNVAGTRGSKEPGVCDFVRDVLDQAFSQAGK
jgi:hypothetical protein